jgi:hypothetical protein
MDFSMSNKYARTSLGSIIKILNIERPFSNFDFIENEFGEFPQLRRIMSQVRQHNGKSLIFEKVDESLDLCQENEDIIKRSKCKVESQSFRLSFFKRRALNYKDILRMRSKDFIGYAIIKRDVFPENDIRTRIFESVILPSKRENNFIRGATKWTCMVNCKSFEVQGYLYCQQNGISNVCAHVALRTAASRYNPEGDITYRRMNEIAGIDLSTYDLAQNGLDIRAMQRILEDSGAVCFVGDYESEQPPIPFQKYIYGSIESGYPAIVVFKADPQDPEVCHAIPIFGHTFNEDTWVPRAESSYFKIGNETTYIPSDSWLSMYIMHDDNWGSNYCVPREYLNKSEKVSYVICTLPKDVKVDPISAEALGAHYLLTIRPQIAQRQEYSEGWGRRLEYYAIQNLLVLRPILINKNQYLSHLRTIKDWRFRRIDTTIIEFLSNEIPDEMLWMVELSVPELFSANRRKVGEVVLRAEIQAAPEKNLDSYIVARLPGCFAFIEDRNPSSPGYFFIPSGASGHVELYNCEDREKGVCLTKLRRLISRKSI